MTELWDELSNMVWNILHRPRIADILDILIVAFLIYQLLKYTRQTRVSQVAKGIVVLLLASWLSELFGMRTLSTLLKWVISAGPVVLIVVFQPEIRRMLEGIGNSSLFDRVKTDDREIEVALIVTEMTRALLNMAKRRVGALIVIERRTRLTEIINTGTQVDGLISQPLIENIFEPNTPLHDGAVIVRGDRVVAAACLLNLSEGTGISRDLGTRHRAGLGISETTDATVFIVSEETGIVSMARGGKLTRHLDARSIELILHELYDAGPSEPQAPSLMNFFKRRQRHDERSDQEE
ncbi:diadenylate cyclase CdaA [Beduinella massiliensis]|uniref:diadenylate cyclase CdaA n=1 Tax=Beduinella massiliensis TaxID=1852363 RepID=UPI0011AF87BF